MSHPDPTREYNCEQGDKSVTKEKLVDFMLLKFFQYMKGGHGYDEAKKLMMKDTDNFIRASEGFPAER